MPLLPAWLKLPSPFPECGCLAHCPMPVGSFITNEKSPTLVGCRQIGHLGWFTSFFPMGLKFSGERLTPAHQRYNTSRLKEQERQYEEAVDDGVQVTA